jgi:hypothetical protein
VPSVAPPSESELDAIRAEADRFLASLDEEYYLHYAGHKERLELTPIYERHARLARLETAAAIGSAVGGDRRRRELWRFACERYLGAVTREHDERLARAEAELVAKVDGADIPYRQLRPAIANEPDRERRRRLEAARNDLTETHLLPIQLEAALATRSAVRELGPGSYLDLYREGFAMALDDLADGCRAVLEETAQLWSRAGDDLFRRGAGVGLDEAERWDTPRVFRSPEWDKHFPEAQMIPALEATLADLGIDLRSQANVHLDVERRPLKSPRAFCSPIEIPEKVMLVIQPIGGHDDWKSLFHEAGHTEHFAHTSPDLRMEERRLGDNAVTEGWATLFQRLTDDPGWLTRRLDFPRPEEYARQSAAAELWFVRRYCAKLLYELELHAAEDPTALRDRYVELLADALGVTPSSTDYLADVDPGFYVSSYLRSWAFEAQLRDFLRGEFGTRWFARREAGSLLRELWELGQKPTAEELLHDVTGSKLELAAVVERSAEAGPR